MDIHSIRGPLSLKSIWKAPLHQSPSGPLRFLIRSTLSLAGRKLVSCQGVEHIQPDHDPFILVLNHSQKLEAIYIPALLYYHQSTPHKITQRLYGGRPVVSENGNSRRDRWIDLPIQGRL